MRTEDLKNIILRMFGHKKFYGYEIHKKLASENIKIEISRLYRVLNEMMKDKLLEGRWEKSHIGPGKESTHLAVWEERNSTKCSWTLSKPYIVFTENI